MLLRNKSGVYTLTMLADFKNLVCAFSTLQFGNMKPALEKQITQIEKNKEEFLKRLSLKKPANVTAEQIHGSRVAYVNNNNSGRNIKGADGLATKEKNLFLMVFVADCLPIVAYDPKKEIVGIAHAGWKGTLSNIAQNLILAFRDVGSETKNILVGFGPSIEFCHYEVGADVAAKFCSSNLKNSILKSRSGKFFLDLKLANTIQLLKTGVLKPNIDISIKACTYENPDFYSLRRGDKNERFMAIMGMKNGN